ncbi:MAG TPA: methyltransferase domain-containing protein [Verrucomicrobiae bacterium]|nr:methyltransferase domain-containing protein [Verrucomicrobiae bacterium]
MPIEAVTSLVTFGSELLNNPRPIGSAVPSSPFLARRMASYVPRAPRGYVIELGAGTGAITAALLKRGIPAEKIVSVERSETLVRLLKRRFPSLKVALGDAGDLRTLLKTFLGKETVEVSHVVSSLPLRSLPQDVVASIVREVHAVLPSEGKLVQYTYNLGKAPNPCLSGFKRIRTAVVWANVPPARVDVFQKNGKTPA